MILSVLGHLLSGDKRLNCPFKISPHIVRGFIYGIEIAKCYSVSVNADFLFEIDRFVSLAVFQIVIIFVLNVINMIISVLLQVLWEPTLWSCALCLPVQRALSLHGPRM